MCIAFRAFRWTGALIAAQKKETRQNRIINLRGIKKACELETASQGGANSRFGEQGNLNREKDKVD